MRAVGQEGLVERGVERGAAAIVDGPFGWQSEQVGQNRGHTRGEQFAHSKIAEIAGKMICPRTPCPGTPAPLLSCPRAMQSSFFDGAFLFPLPN